MPPPGAIGPPCTSSSPQNMARFVSEPSVTERKSASIVQVCAGSTTSMPFASAPRSSLWKAVLNVLWFAFSTLSGNSRTGAIAPR